MKKAFCISGGESLFLGFQLQYLWTRALHSPFQACFLRWPHLECKSSKEPGFFSILNKFYKGRWAWKKKKNSKPELKIEKQHKGKKCGFFWFCFFFPEEWNYTTAPWIYCPITDSICLKAIFGTSVKVSTVFADKQKFGFALKVKMQHRSDW